MAWRRLTKWLLNSMGKNMLEEVGLVVEVHDKTAVVEMMRHASCSHCGLCTLGAQDKMRIEAENSVGARLNDRVKVAIPSAVILKSAFIVYIVPLVALLIGFVTAKYFLGEKAGVVVGLLCAVGVFLGLHFYDKRLRSQQQTLVRITEIV